MCCKRRTHTMSITPATDGDDCKRSLGTELFFDANAIALSQQRQQTLGMADQSCIAWWLLRDSVIFFWALWPAKWGRCNWLHPMHLLWLQVCLVACKTTSFVSWKGWSLEAFLQYSQVEKRDKGLSCIGHADLTMAWVEEKLELRTS